MTTVKLFGYLFQGTVINFRIPTGEDVKYVVLRQYISENGSFTEVLNLETYEKEIFPQSTLVSNSFSIIKEQIPKTFDEFFAVTGFKPIIDENGNKTYSFKAKLKE